MKKHLFTFKEPIDKWYVMIAGVVGTTVGMFLKKTGMDFLYGGLLVSLGAGLFFGGLLLAHRKIFLKK